MRIRRPIAALVTALALFGGGTATLTACGDPSGTDRSDGTQDDQGEQESGSDPGSEEQGNLPDNSDPEQDQENEDVQDPD